MSAIYRAHFSLAQKCLATATLSWSGFCHSTPKCVRPMTPAQRVAALPRDGCTRITTRGRGNLVGSSVMTKYRLGSSPPLYHDSSPKAWVCVQYCQRTAHLSTAARTFANTRCARATLYDGWRQYLCRFGLIFCRALCVTGELR